MIGGGAKSALWRQIMADVYGKPIIGAEAFTAADHEKWLHHPGSIKALGDRAFCDGVNHFIWHTFSASPDEFGKPGIIELQAEGFFNENQKLDLVKRVKAKVQIKVMPGLEGALPV